MEDGSVLAMATGQVLAFPGWDTLRAMPPELVKEWLLSKQFAQDGYVAVVGGESHRGVGGLPPAARTPSQRPGAHQGDQGAHTEGTQLECDIPPPWPIKKPEDIPVGGKSPEAHADDEGRAGESLAHAEGPPEELAPGEPV